jgi:hypothetical protein
MLFCCGVAFYERLGSVLSAVFCDVLFDCREESGDRLVITSKGFGFLFKDSASQVWDYIISLLDGLEVSAALRDP